MSVNTCIRYPFTIDHCYEHPLLRRKPAGPSVIRSNHMRKDFGPWRGDGERHTMSKRGIGPLGGPPKLPQGFVAHPSAHSLALWTASTKRYLADAASTRRHHRVAVPLYRGESRLDVGWQRDLRARHVLSFQIVIGT